MMVLCRIRISDVSVNLFRMYMLGRMCSWMVSNDRTMTWQYVDVWALDRSSMSKTWHNLKWKASISSLETHKNNWKLDSKKTSNYEKDGSTEIWFISGLFQHCFCFALCTLVRRSVWFVLLYGRPFYYTETNFIWQISTRGFINWKSKEESSNYSPYQSENIVHY